MEQKKKLIILYIQHLYVYLIKKGLFFVFWEYLTWIFQYYLYYTKFSTALLKNFQETNGGDGHEQILKVKTYTDNKS